MSKEMKKRDENQEQAELMIKKHLASNCSFQEDVDIAYLQKYILNHQS